MSARLRPDLASLPDYVAGRSRPHAVKLASNETTRGPLPSVAQAIAEAAATANRYPDNGATELRSALADVLGVAVARVAVGCGSVALCQELVHATCDPDDEVIFGWRSFEAYPIITQVAHARAVAVPLTRDHIHDLEAMVAAITDRTRLLFVCNPNNPTGTVVDRGALLRLLSDVPEDVLVVLDEAYHEYLRLPAPDFPDGIDFARERPNVIALRTFSKAYGLAGLRVGYAVGDPTVVSALLKVQTPFSVNRVAQAAALACLRARQELLSRTDCVIAERERMTDALRAAGYPIVTSHANFLWLLLGSRSAAFAQASDESGVLVRPYGEEGVRVTVGDSDENDLFLSFAGGAAERFAMPAQSAPTATAIVGHARGNSSAQ